MNSLASLAPSPAPRAPTAWHISAPVDSLAYAFSWLPILGVLALFGQRYFIMASVYIGVSVVSEVHRCYTFGYAFLGPEVKARSRGRFVILPLVLLGCALLCPLLLTLDARRATFGHHFDALLEGASVVAGAWNIYHVVAQKFGLLRVYAGKLGGRTAPRGADRALMFSGLLLVPAWLLPKETPTLLRMYPSGWMADRLQLLGRLQTPLLIVAVSGLLAALSWFLVTEWRANRLSSRPRLTLAAGTLLLCASFVVLRPLYAYLAFAFSHAVEYMVFVGAFLRRRASHTEDRLTRLVRRPFITYPAFMLGLGVIFFFAGPWIRTLYPSFRWTLLGADGTSAWVRPWIIFSSLLHFYYDGVLWRVRRPELQRDL